MPIWCLEKSKAQAFLNMIRSGQISPAQLAAMKTSEERRAFFAKHFGEENAKSMNLALEKKLILKNQQQGLVTWAKQVAGLKPAARRDLLSRVERMDKVLDPKEGAFYEDLAGHVLGTAVTQDESVKITEMAKVAQENEVKAKASPREQGSVVASKAEQAWGDSVVAFNNYVNVLKKDAGKLTAKERVIKALKNPAVALLEGTSLIAGMSKALRATFDLSYTLMQGSLNILAGTGEHITGPITKIKPTKLKISWDNSKKGIRSFINTFGANNAQDKLMGTILSDPEYDEIRRTGVAISSVEEDIPVTIQEKIPFVGKFIEASDNAFTVQAHYQRYAGAKAMLGALKQSQTEAPSKEQLASIGTLVNSFSMRGKFRGVRDKPGLGSNLFWSVRKMKGLADVLTAHVFDKNVTARDKRLAAINLANIAVATYAIQLIAYAIDPESVEWDFRSADAGKIKIGNTRIVVNPLASMISLGVRLATGETKSTTTGKIKKLEPGFGKTSRLDVLVNWFANKLAPFTTVVKDRLAEEDRDRRPPTITGDLVKLAVPLSIENYFEFKADSENPDSVMTDTKVLLFTLAEVFGAFGDTYSKYQGLARDDVRFEIKQADTRKKAMKKLANRAWDKEALTPEYREQVAKWKEFPDLKKALDAKLGSAAYGLTEKRRKDQTKEEYKEAQGVRRTRLKQAGVDLSGAQRLLKETMRARRIVKATVRRQRIQRLDSAWGDD